MGGMFLTDVTLHNKSVYSPGGNLSVGFVTKITYSDAWKEFSLSCSLQVSLISNPVTAFHFAMQRCVFQYLEYVQYVLLSWGWMSGPPLKPVKLIILWLWAPHTHTPLTVCYLSGILSLRLSSHLNLSSWECWSLICLLCKSTPPRLKAHRNHLMTNGLPIKEAVDINMFKIDKLWW